MIKHQVIAILKMRITKILLLLLITLNLISFISLNNQKEEIINQKMCKIIKNAVNSLFIALLMRSLLFIEITHKK